MFGGLHYLAAKPLISLRQPFHTEEQMAFRQLAANKETDRSRDLQRKTADFFLQDLGQGPVQTPYTPPGAGTGEVGAAPPCLPYSQSRTLFRANATRISQWVPSLSGLCRVDDSGGKQTWPIRVVIPMARNNSTLNAQPAGHVRGRVLANAQIIQFAPYLARNRSKSAF
jgi:hypothetical protein